VAKQDAKQDAKRESSEELLTRGNRTRECQSTCQVLLYQVISGRGCRKVVEELKYFAAFERDSMRHSASLREGTPEWLGPLAGALPLARFHVH
jgi:hypothetical protein